jgi:hypothetical protein
LSKQPSSGPKTPGARKQQNNPKGAHALQRKILAKVKQRQGHNAFPTDAHDLKELFTVYDADSSNALSLEEFVVVINDLWQSVPVNGKNSSPKARKDKPEITKMQVKNLMGWIDGNDDIEVDVDEFIQFFQEAHKVEQLQQAIERQAQKSQTQRNTMICYFTCVFICFGVFLVTYLEELAEKEDHSHVTANEQTIVATSSPASNQNDEEDESSGVGEMGLILSSVALLIGVFFLFCMPIFELHFGSKLEKRAIYRATMKPPSTSSLRIKVDEEQIAEELALKHERDKKEIAEMQAEAQGKMKFTYRLKKIEEEHFHNQRRLLADVRTSGFEPGANYIKHVS